MLERLIEFASLSHVAMVTRALVVLVLGYFVIRVLSAGLRRVLSGRISAQSAMITTRLTRYTLIGLVLFAALQELGFDLKVMLGAAGLLTVAIGFAAQTSTSNLISGLFLMGERPFVVGDVVKVGETVGEVVSIDLLSVRLRTFDNLMVRVPNEQMVKSTFTNLTHFPIRRFDLKLVVPFEHPLAEVRQVLLGVPQRLPIALEEPAPAIIYLGYTPMGVEIQLSVWAARANFLTLRNELCEGVKEALSASGLPLAIQSIDLRYHPSAASAPPQEPLDSSA